MQKWRRPLPPDLRRRSKKLVNPRLKLTIFCEGKNTEPHYFEAMARAFGNGLVAVETIPGVGVPGTVVAEAIKARKRHRSRQTDSYSKKDEFWVAFDCDDHPNLGNAMQSARQNKVSIAYSNPCIELWGILHFMDQNAPISSADAQRTLSSLMKSYNRNGAKLFDFDAMLPGYDVACERAKKMAREREREGSPQGNPFTNVYLLTQLISTNGRIRRPR
jgi:hypothetical protein